MERFRVLGVRLFHDAALSRREVKQPEVGLVVPDAELPVVGKRVAEETSVVGRTGERHGFVLHTRIDKGVYSVTEAACCRVEINTAEIIADGVYLIATSGRTEIERAAIGGEYGIGLEDRVLPEQGREQQFILINIVHLKVGGLVEYLDAVAAGTVEKLPRGVGGLGDIAARGMPGGIDAETDGLICLGIVGGEGTAVMAQQRGTVRAADVEAHVGRVAAVEAVAVAASLKLRIFYQRTLLERGQVALIDAHLAPHLIAWLNKTIAETIVDTVRTDMDGERLVGMPAIVIFGRNSHAE